MWSQVQKAPLLNVPPPAAWPIVGAPPRVVWILQSSHLALSAHRHSSGPGAHMPRLYPTFEGDRLREENHRGPEGPFRQEIIGPRHPEHQPEMGVHSLFDS